MDIARPKSGFVVSEPDDFRQYIEAQRGEFPRLPEMWEALKERLKMTAHREGAPYGKPGERVFEATGDPSVGIPHIRVAYHVLGEHLQFRKILVFGESAAEEADDDG